MEPIYTHLYNNLYFIDIVTIYRNPNCGVHQITNSEKLKILGTYATYWPKHRTCNWKDTLSITHKGHPKSKVSYGDILEHRELTLPYLRRTSYNQLLPPHTLVRCRNNMETRSNLEIPDNLFEAQLLFEPNN